MKHHGITDPPPFHAPTKKRLLQRSPMRFVAAVYYHGCLFLLVVGMCHAWVFHGSSPGRLEYHQQGRIRIGNKNNNKMFHVTNTRWNMSERRECENDHRQHQSPEQPNPKTGCDGEGLISSSSIADSFLSRRQAFGSIVSGPLVTLLLTVAGGCASPVARARGLVQFPCAQPFANRYHLMRVGQSALEAKGIWSTNPLFLTNQEEDSLTALGEEQVRMACDQLRSGDAFPTVIKYSLAAACLDTATIVARELQLGRDRLVPEFTFMDPRAIGKWDMFSREEAIPAVWAMDVDEAGPYGYNGRPPPNEDGTPHETLADQAVRLRQLLSVLESQYSGDTILLVFPDGTGPALLSAMIAGIPYNRVHELEFSPGEIRRDVTLESIRVQWQNRPVNPSYEATIERGRKLLLELRSRKDIVSLKDQMIEKERVALEEAYRLKEREKQRNRDLEQRALRERQMAVANGQDDGFEIPPSILATASVTMAGAFMYTTVSAQQDKAMLSNRVVPVTNGSPGPGGLYNSTMSVSSIGGGDTVTQNSSYQIQASSFATRDNQRIRINGDSSGSLPVKEPSAAAAKQELARLAMEEYMNRDDGADDWLNSLAEIIAEDDESSNED